ncbi:putative c6 transcription factor [Phaeomoniella chlamydospora]|uniref:Putative c6 transcription factor n=1 Tax=Phaeomoniella chlamydospora TaxID=158046 RepID=A0A0G2HD51_PHACM|nr:putative c6 transcription factor [Phaeomoniella chlamydospora]
MQASNRTGRISTACESCKRKKARCIIDANRDRRRKASTHRLEDELQQYKQVLKVTLETVERVNPAVHQSVLERLRADIDIAECLDTVFERSDSSPPSSEQKGDLKGSLVNIRPKTGESKDTAWPDFFQEANDRESRFEGFLNIILNAPIKEVEEILGQLRYLSNNPKFSPSSEMQVSTEPTHSTVNLQPIHETLLAEAVQHFMQDREVFARSQNRFQHHKNASPALLSALPHSRSPAPDPQLSSTGYANSQNPASLFRYDTDAGNAPEEGALWSQLSLWVRAATILPALFGTFARDLDDHVTITGVTQGWNVTRSQVTLDPQWEIISQWESEALSHGRQIDRLALVRLLRRGLKYYAAIDHDSEEVRNSIPEFLQPVNGQALIESSNIINFMPWPGVRIRMIEDQQNGNWTYGNEFWKNYLSSYRFDWNVSATTTTDGATSIPPPSDTDGDVSMSSTSSASAPFSPTAAYTFDSTKSMMAFTKEFDIKWNDLNCWTLKQEFLDRFPLLKGEARVF